MGFTYSVVGLAAAATTVMTDAPPLLLAALKVTVCAPAYGVVPSAALVR